ncbi:MAG: hypothetical protein ACREB7_05060 [Sphingopyxis sp.]|uniref:hypothetical protein n=1 Tax=Sphingopyxis sp. TaxID=1908224 RepID=UPI003D6CA0AC
MRGTASTLAMLGALHFAVSAQACVKVTPTVRAWAQCGYKVASATGDHKFMVNFAKAKFRKRPLLKTAQPRWDKLEARIIAKCGTFAAAAAADEKELKTLRKKLGAVYVPDDQFMAISDTGNITILVEKDA